MSFITDFFTILLPAFWMALRRGLNDLVIWVKPHAKKLWKTIIILVIIVVGIPIVATTISVAFQAKWFTSLIGIILALTLTVFMLKPFYLAAALLIGIVWELTHFNVVTISDKVRDTGKIYLDIVLIILLWELIIVFYVAIFPVWNNLRAIPIVAMCALILCLITYVWGFNKEPLRKLVWIIVATVFVIQTLSFCWPKTTKAVSKKWPEWDTEIATSINSPRQQRTALFVPSPSLSRPGTLTVPAGQGLYKTMILVKKGEQIWIDANPVAILLDCKTGNKIKIPTEGILLPPTRKAGKLFFVKQQDSSLVNYRIGI